MMGININGIMKSVVKVQDQARVYLRNRNEIISQVRKVADRGMGELKTAIAKESPRVKQFIKKSQGELERLLKLLPSLEEGQQFLVKNLGKQAKELEKTVKTIVGKKVSIGKLRSKKHLRTAMKAAHRKSAKVASKN